jgi:23S rRNA (pseudouridine1915-N3)-methyltransferase
MLIRIIAVGKLKEKYWQDAVKEYRKRMEPYTKVEIVEIGEEKLPEHPSAAEIKLALTKEGESIRRQIPPSSYVICLAIKGKMLSSEELSDFISRQTLQGHSKIVFIIGSSYGLSQEVLGDGDFLLSFSPMTFPHQMMRVILLEQLYRSFKIAKGEPYHK